MIYNTRMNNAYRLHRWELRPRCFLNFIQPLFSVTQHSVRRMSGKAAEQLRASRVEKMRLNTVLIFHGCESFDEFDLSICVESIDQKEDDRDLFLEQSCCNGRLVFEVERERRGIVVGLDFFGLLLASYEGIYGAMKRNTSCVLELGK